MIEAKKQIDPVVLMGNKVYGYYSEPALDVLYNLLKTDETDVKSLVAAIAELVEPTLERATAREADFVAHSQVITPLDGKI